MRNYVEKNEREEKMADMNWRAEDYYSYEKEGHRYIISKETGDLFALFPVGDNELSFEEKMLKISNQVTVSGCKVVKRLEKIQSMLNEISITFNHNFILDLLFADLKMYLHRQAGKVIKVIRKEQIYGTSVDDILYSFLEMENTIRMMEVDYRI